MIPSDRYQFSLGSVHEGKTLKTKGTRHQKKRELDICYQFKNTGAYTKTGYILNI